MLSAREPADGRRVVGERGFTLIELMITLMTTVIVLGVLAGFLASAGRSQQAVTSSSSVVQSAKLFTQSITVGVQNAYVLALDPTVTGGQLLRAETLVAAQNSSGAVVSRWQCIAWYWNQTDQTVRSTTSPSGKVATPSATQLRSWTLLADGVTGGLGTASAPAVFSVQTTETSLPNTTIDFFAAAPGGRPQEFVSTIQALPVPSPSATIATGGPLSCV